jgi:hypothetical protein
MVTEVIFVKPFTKTSRPMLVAKALLGGIRRDGGYTLTPFFRIYMAIHIAFFTSSSGP